MSLISLASTTINDIQQQPYNFKNHFPQPLIIKPHSQVCLVNFYHFRDEGYYRIVENNNTIAFAITKDLQYGALRYAKLNNGKYTGDALATEISRALNSVLLQENYTFSCTFTEGNPVANPPTTDAFAISYTNVPTPSSTGGEWTSISIQNGFDSAKIRETGLLQITNNNTAGAKSVIKNISSSGDNRPKSAILRKGIRLHEGFVSWENVGQTGFAQDFDDENPHEFICGIVRNGNSCDDFGVPFETENKAHFFDSNYADIKCNLRKVGEGGMKLVITTLNQKQGASSLYQPNGKGRKQTVRRFIEDGFFSSVFNDFQDRMKFIIHINSGQRAYVVCLQKSTDLGVTFSDIPDGTGGNALDGRPVVYSQTIGGVPYTSVIYSTVGVPNGAGGIVAKSKIANQSAVKYAPLYPFCNLSDNFNHINGIDLDNALINASTSNAGIGADQVFQMLFNDDESGNGYDYFLDVSAVAVTPDANINSTFFDQLAFKVKAGTNGLNFDVYTNNLTPIGSATPIGELRTFPKDGVNGTCSFVGLSPPQLNPMVFEFDATAKPIPETSSVEIKCEGVFNTIGNLPTDQFGESKGGEHTESLHFNEDGSDALEENTTNHAGLGVDFDQDFIVIVDRPSQADINTFRNAPVRLTGDVMGGSAGATLGLTQNVYSISAGVNALNSDGFPFKEIDDNSIHISIPELSNTKSFEGEAENTGKTIKVIPKNEFTQISTAGSMTFTANYEDWIDINNENELHLNEMTVQVRKPDGKMAVSLQPITRATIKIQQDPEIKAMRRQEELLDVLQRNKASAQSTGQIASFNKPSYVGS